MMSSFPIWAEGLKKSWYILWRLCWRLGAHTWTASARYCNNMGYPEVTEETTCTCMEWMDPKRMF